MALKSMEVQIIAIILQVGVFLLVIRDETGLLKKIIPLGVVVSNSIIIAKEPAVKRLII